MHLPWYVIVVGIGAILVLLLILAIRNALRAGPSTLKAPLIFTIARWGALIYALITGVALVIGVAMSLIGDVTVDVPVREFWPALDPRITVTNPADATITGGGFTTATLTIAGLDLPTRILLALEVLLEGGMYLTIAIAIALVCGRVTGGRPFTPTLAKATTTASIAVALGGIGSQIVGGIAASMASHQALFISGWSATDVGPTEDLTLGLPEATVFVEVNFWPILLFVVLGALAGLFSYAERLQRQAEQLERDTAGLV